MGADPITVEYKDGFEYFEGVRELMTTLNSHSYLRRLRGFVAHTARAGELEE